MRNEKANHTKEEYTPLLEAALESDIYSNVHPLHNEWVITNSEEAACYMPSPPPLKVTLGISHKKTLSIAQQDTVVLGESMENRRGFIIRTGGSIFGLDFVPKRPSVDSEPSVAYLAVGGYRGAHEEHHTLNEIQSGYQNALQIWRYGQTTGLDTEKPSLAMCILHDYGVVYELKWCPYGAYEEVSSVQGTWPKLGILAAAFGDGTVRLLVVPHPKAIQKGQETVYLRVEAVRSTFAYPRINCRSIAWGGHSFLAMGSTSGSIMVQNAMLSLVGSPSVRRNTMIYHSNQHEGSVESIAWYGSLESCFFASTGRDGRTLVHDLRDVSTIGEVCRVTGTRHAVAWKPTMGVFFLSNDNSVQHASVSFDPIQSITKLTKHIGHSSQVWSISTSEFHDCIASGSTDGYFNIMDPTLTRMKTRTQLHRIMYKLVWNEATSTLRYIDGKYVFSPVQDANVWGYASHPILSVQRTVWNPNKVGSGWIASGGSAGLCRIEFIGCGPLDGRPANLK